ncbi:MAG: hypothetical protein PQJ58_13840 [Spirochaetales bacterium]|nr:hypothetical protein [Spirochaetales bacterium]
MNQQFDFDLAKTDFNYSLRGYLSSLDSLMDLVSDLSDDVYQFVPPLQDSWSIKKQIHHLLEKETNSFVLPNRDQLQLTPGKVREYKMDGDGLSPEQVFDELKRLRTIVSAQLQITKISGNETCSLISGSQGTIEMSWNNGLIAIVNHQYFHEALIERNIELIQE